MKKPNIIIFDPDQMRADSMGHLGNPRGNMVWAKIKRWVPAELEEEYRQRIRGSASQYELAVECRNKFGKG